MKSPSRKNKFVGIGGNPKGKRKFANTKIAHWYQIHDDILHRATRTEIKNRCNFALQLVELRTTWQPIWLYLEYDRSHSYLQGNTDVYYIHAGQMRIGKVAISLWNTSHDKIEIEWQFFKKEDYRQYKASTHTNHNYNTYYNSTGEYDYQAEKDRNRNRWNDKKTY